MRTNHKIFNIAKSRLTSFGAAILFNVTLAAAVCGTFAWYTYATRTGLEKQYHGTTVGDMGSLQAGLISDKKLENFLDYDLAEDDRTLADEGKWIYWCKEHIEARTINYVLASNGYATFYQHPVTTGSFDCSQDNQEDFQLYRRPSFLDNYSVVDPTCIAGREDYSRLSFVFRFEDIDNIGQYLPNYNIFLSKCEVEATGDERNEIYKAARIYFRNGYEQYLINPTAEEDGTDVVGGILDLDADGFYDYDENGYEVVYGETNDYAYNSTLTPEDGTLNWRDVNTFVANHKQGVYAVNDESFDPKTVSYTHLEKFTSKAKPITTTDESYYNLGRFDMFIYFEGWDKRVVDNQKGYGYNLDLVFSVQL